MKNIILIAILAFTPSAFAQRPYATNVAATVNVQCVPGWTLATCPVTDGSNNLAASELVAPFAGMEIWAWQVASTNYTILTNSSGAWSGDTSLTIPPGRGFWIRNPGTNSETATFTGNVVQGTNTVDCADVQIYGCPIPHAGYLETDLGYAPGMGDSIFKAVPGSGVYEQYNWYTYWIPEEPYLKVGEGFWIYNYLTNTTWTLIYEPHGFPEYFPPEARDDTSDLLTPFN